MLSAPGIGSGLDVNSIVSQLMAVERQPLNTLSAKEAGYQAKLSAYGSVKGAVAGFQTALQGLNSASRFQTLTATTSDSSVFSASTTSIAVAGTYSLEVSSLAQAQKLVATGQAVNPGGAKEFEASIKKQIDQVTAIAKLVGMKTR